jgi:hypothetical protein
MASVARTITLNPIEPAPFSLRVASGLQTAINVALFDQTGAVLRTDLALQMQLTGRSDGLVTAYAMPSTDVVNGKAMAVIPKDALKDVNGYNVAIYGTLHGGAELIATGVLRLVGGPGVTQQPSDLIDEIPITVYSGQAFAMRVKLWQDEGKSIPYDLTVTPVTAAIYLDAGAVSPLLPFTQTPAGLNEVILSLTVEQIATLPATCWWDLRAGSAAGMTTLAQGTVTVVASGVTL